MGFLKRLFGGDTNSKKRYEDKQGIYFYVQCAHCQTIVRVRADKQYDLNRDGNKLFWHKTVVDSRCFRRMRALVELDNNYTIVQQAVEGGQFVTEADYLATQRPTVNEMTDTEPVSE